MTAEEAQAVLQGEAWMEKNARRCELIRKKNRGGLSRREQVELFRLQTEAEALLGVAYPKPPTNNVELVKLREKLWGRP